MATDLENLKERLLRISSKDSPRTNIVRKPKIQITPKMPVQFPQDESELDDDDFPTEEEELAQTQPIEGTMEEIMEQSDDMIEEVDEIIEDEPVEEPIKRVPMRSPVRAVPQISRKPQFAQTQPQSLEQSQQVRQPMRQPLASLSRPVQQVQQQQVQQQVRQPLMRQPIKPVQQVQRQQPVQQVQQPIQQPSQEDIENYQQQILQEIARLRDNGQFNIEILTQFNRLNNNIETLIRALSE